MKDILIITSYFPPEIGAASNRIFHLAEGLQKRQFKVSVLTPLPNYPTGKIFKSYRRKFKTSTVENNIAIHRLWIYATNSKNKILRLLAMISYSLSLMWYLTFHKIPKTVIVQSPPLLVAFTCCVLLRSKRRNLILNVSDLWPLAGFELGALKKNFGYRILERIEKSNYKKANLIMGQSEEILSHVKTIFPNKRTVLYRNYPNFEPPETPIIHQEPGRKIKTVYAGLLGVAQGILKLCQELNYETIEFHIYGSGAECDQLENYIKSHPQLPIFYHGQLTRKALHQKLLHYDVGIIPLLNRVYGSVPSKIFEYAKLGLPIIYFGGGEGETIITKHQLGWVIEAGNYRALNKLLLSLDASKIDKVKKENNKNTVSLHFDFDKQLDALIRLF